MASHRASLLRSVVAIAFASLIAACDGTTRPPAPPTALPHRSRARVRAATRGRRRTRTGYARRRLVFLFATPMEGSQITGIAQHVVDNPAIKQMFMADGNDFLNAQLRRAYMQG